MNNIKDYSYLCDKIANLLSFRRKKRNLFCFSLNFT